MKPGTIALVVCMAVLTALFIVAVALVLWQYANRQECRKQDAAWLSTCDAERATTLVVKDSKEQSPQSLSSSQEQGYVMIALGKKFHELAMIGIQSIRRFDKRRPIQVICDTTDIDFSSIDSKTRCTMYPRDTLEKVWGRGCTSFESKGTIPKLAAMTLATFSESMLMDVDAVPVRELDSLWERCSASGHAMVIAGRADKDNRAPHRWHWGFINSISRKCGFPIPEINSGVVYFKRDVVGKDFDELVLPYYRNHKKYGIKELFRGGLPDEIFLAIYMGIKGIPPADYDDWAIQRFIFLMLMPQHLRFPARSKKGSEYYFYHFFRKNTNSMQRCSKTAAAFWKARTVYSLSTNSV